MMKKVYEGSDLSVGECIDKLLLLDRYFLENCTTKKSLYNVFEIAHEIMPKPNYLPKNKYSIMKFIDKIMTKCRVTKKDRICEDCSQYLGEHNAKPQVTVCPNCSSEKVNAIFAQYDLKELLKNAFEIQNLSHYIDLHRKQYQNNDPNIICDISSGTHYQYLEKNILKGGNDVVLLWNTDGFPISQSSNGQVWLVQAEIVNVRLTSRLNFRFACGIYYSREKKPNMSSFLKPTVDCFKDLYDSGLDWFDKTSNSTKHSIVVAPIATLDAPAEAMVQNTHQYNGEFCCGSCEHPGETCATESGSTTVYPEINPSSEARTHDKMIKQANEAIKNNLEHVNGVKRPSIAALIPLFCIATSFIPDYMNAILLGVFRMLMSLWFDTKNKYCPWYIKKSYRDIIDQQLQNISPPDYVTRTPRSILKSKHF